MNMATLLTVGNLAVHYGATTALDGVDIEVRTGDVHAVVGENGAGKSTLLRAIAGTLRPTAGDIRSRPGVRLAWVPQEPDLPPDFTATEWIFLGCELRKPWGWLRRKAMDQEAGSTLRALGCPVAPRTRLGALAPPQRKQVQLARAIRINPDLLLLDEPTAVLGDAETRRLFATVRALGQSGCGVLYVSHRLEEVLEIADRVTVLRDGRVVSTDPVGAVDVRTLVQRMVGRDIPAREHTGRMRGEPILRVADIAVAHVRGFSLTVRDGEVVGLAGLVGAGRSETLEAIAGLRPLRSGRIECVASPVLVPEDRSRNGLVSSLRLRENLFLPAGGWLIRRSRERREAAAWVERLSIRCRGADAPITSLSGGNQQKLLLARALRLAPKLLLLDEPTAGVDVGAKAEIHALVDRLAQANTALLIASSDLPELILLCDRIIALRAGRVVGELAARDSSETRLAALITGASLVQS